MESTKIEILISGLFISDPGVDLLRSRRIPRENLFYFFFMSSTVPCCYDFKSFKSFKILTIVEPSENSLHFPVNEGSIQDCGKTRVSAACKHVTSVSCIQNEGLFFYLISEFPCASNTLRYFYRFFYFNKNHSFSDFCFQIFRKRSRDIYLNSGICLKNFRKASYMIPVLMRNDQFFNSSRINMKFPHMFEEESSIPTCIEKKDFAICFNKSCKSPASYKILTGCIVVNYSKCPQRNNLCNLLAIGISIGDLNCENQDVQ